MGAAAGRVVAVATQRAHGVRKKAVQLRARGATAKRCGEVRRKGGRGESHSTAASWKESRQGTHLLGETDILQIVVLHELAGWFASLRAGVAHHRFVVVLVADLRKRA